VSAIRVQNGRRSLANRRSPQRPFASTVSRRPSPTTRTLAGAHDHLESSPNAGHWPTNVATRAGRPFAGRMAQAAGARRRSPQVPVADDAAAHLRGRGSQPLPSPSPPPPPSPSPCCRRCHRRHRHHHHHHRRRRHHHPHRRHPLTSVGPAREAPPGREGARHQEVHGAARDGPRDKAAERGAAASAL